MLSFVRAFVFAQEKSKVASDKPLPIDAAKKLSSFTIPKHKNPQSNISRPTEPGDGHSCGPHQVTC